MNLFRDGSTRLFAGNHEIQTNIQSERVLTMQVRWVQPQCLQYFCTCPQKELRALHPEQIHRSKTETSKTTFHVPHEPLICETRERQPTSQWGYREGNEVCTRCALWFLFGERVGELEICRGEPSGFLKARNRRVGAKCLKHRSRFGVRLDTRRESIPSSWRFAGAEK